MARISSYDQDGTLNKLDKVLGTDSVTGDTKNYTIDSMLQLVNTEGLVEAFDGASFTFSNYVASADEPQGIINLNAGVASAANFSDINEIYISTVDKSGLSIAEYLENSLENQVKISLKGNVNQFGIYEVTAIADHDGGAYKRLTVIPRSYNGTLAVDQGYFLSNYSAVFDQDFSDDSVTEFSDVHHAGSGRIITNDERTNLTNLTTNALVHGDVVDNVTSSASNVPLSANQGKILKGLINDINTLLTSDNVNLDTLQEVVDFIEANRESLNALAISNIAGLQNALDAKQNAEAGKGLSANDFTDTLLGKLNNISANAEVNVNANWAETNTESDAFIENKPTDVTDLAQHSVTELNNVTSAGSGAIISSAERTKLTNINVNITNRTVTDGTTSIVVPPANAEQNVNADWNATTGYAEILNKPQLAPANAEQNVQSNWNETDSTSDAFILNKPALAPSNAEQNVQVDWSETNTASDAFILNKPALAPSNAEQNVQANWTETDTSSDAFIQNKPALAPANAEQNVQADWSETATDSDAFILNKPALAPSNAEQNVQADWNESDNTSDAFILNKPALAPSNAEQNVQVDWDESDNTSDAFILNKPDVSITKAKVDTALGTGAADDTYFYRGDGTWADPAAAISLGDLSNVDGTTTETGVNDGAVLQYNTTLGWIGSRIAIEKLYNVEPNSTNSVGKVMVSKSFNAQNSTNTYGLKTLELDDLGDFTITTPEDKQILQYNSTSSHWENVTNLQLPGTLEFATTETTTPSFDNGIYVSTEDGHDVMHFRYHGHDLSIDYLTQVLPTGILNGGVLSKANNTQFTIAAGDGIINDLNKGANTDPHPEIIKVSWAEQTITVSNLDSTNTEQLNSWIYVDSTGTVQQQSTAFTDAQKRSNIIIGSAIHSEGVLKFVKTFPHTGYNNASQMNEFAGIFGPMKKSGHKITANGANLSIDRAAGVSFALGRNYANDPENPSTVSDAAKTQCVIHRYYGDGSGGFVLDDGTAGAGYTTLDPGNYDDGSGTLATTSGGQYTVQRLFYFPGTPNIIVAYYGKAHYNSIDIAEKSYILEDFIEAPNTSDQAIYVGAIIMAGGTTDLTDTSDAKFLTAGAFRGLAAITVGGSVAASNLNDLSDVSIQSVANDEVLRYNASTQQWENVSDSIDPITLDTVNTRVGVNKTIPEHTFDVDGDINIQADDSYKIGGVDILNVSSTYTKILHPEGSNAIYLGDSGDRSNYYDNNFHIFRTAGGGTEQFRWDGGTGRMGIGTSSPQAKLHVNGDMIIGGDGSDAVLRFWETNNGWNIRHVASGNRLAMSNVLGGTDHFNITETGSVGIGTTTPARKFTVAGNGNIASFQHSTPTSYAEAEFVNDNSQRLILGSIGSQYANADWAGMRYLYSSSGDLAIKTPGNLRLFSGGVALANERIRIDTNGDVGINTTAPSQKLHVNGAAYFEGGTNEAFAEGGDVQSNTAIVIDSGDKIKVRQGQYLRDLLHQDSTNNIIKIGQAGTSLVRGISLEPGHDDNSAGAQVRVYGGGTEYVRFDGYNKRVGIGITAPVSKFHIASDQTVAARFDWNGSNGGYNQYRSAGQTVAYIGDAFHLISPNTNEFRNFAIRAQNDLILASQTVERLRIDGNGNAWLNAKLLFGGDSEHYIQRATTSLIKGTTTDTTIVSGRTLDLYAYDDVNIRAGSSDKITFTASGTQEAEISGEGLIVNRFIKHMSDLDTYFDFTNNRIRIIAGGNVKFDTDDVQLTTATASNRQSGSDFADGCKVVTSIDSSVTNGASFVIEVTGKSYTSSKPPHKFIAQGYIYNGTIINESAVDLTGSLTDSTDIVMWNDNGNLAFWWQRQGYWNSYSIRVWNASGGSGNEYSQNLVTSISNSARPATTVSKYNAINFSRSLVKNPSGYLDDSLRIGNGSINRVSATESTVSIANSNVASLYLHSTGTNGKEWIQMSASDGTYRLHDRDLQHDIIYGTNSYYAIRPSNVERLRVTTSGITVSGHIATDSGSDRSIRAYHSDGAYTEMRGYGILFNRASAYLRPTTADDKTLYIGASPNLRWQTVDVNISSNFSIRDTGTEVFRVEDSFVKIPTGTGTSGSAGSLRFNTTESKFEGHNGTEWAEIAGGGGGASNITRTSFSGDDSTTQFSLSENIADEAHTQIYISGVYQEKTTYSVSGQQITFSEAPPEGTNNIEVIHMASVTVDGASGITRNTYTGTGSQQSFTLSVTPSSEDFTFVYVDGVYADKNEYTLNNNVITFVSAPANNASVEVMTINAVNIQQTSYLANDTFTGDDSTTTFALVNGQPSNEAFTMVFVQGVYQNKNTYSLSSNSIVFTEAPYTGDAIEVISINGGGVKTLPPTTVDDIRYNVEVINTNTTAQAGYVYVFTGNLTLTLPALPKIGQSIKISNRSGVDTCVLGAGGNKIMGSTDNLTLDTASASFELIYSGNDEGWVIIGQ